jgi:hypothetical protein
MVGPGEARGGERRESRGRPVVVPAEDRRPIFFSTSFFSVVEIEMLYDSWDDTVSSFTHNLPPPSISFLYKQY